MSDAAAASASGSSWVWYALAACVTYTAFSVCIVAISKRDASTVDRDALVVLALLLFVLGGVIAAALLLGVPGLRTKFLQTYVQRSVPAVTVAAIAGMAVLMVTTHLCVYVSIVKAPNAGYAQAIVNVSALLLALVMWLGFGQSLSAIALAGIACITVGSGLLQTVMV